MYFRVYAEDEDDDNDDLIIVLYIGGLPRDIFVNYYMQEVFVYSMHNSSK